ncbi:MAG: DNA polymerase III subunit gamma/tau [Deltaproteobacteria bacterium]|nr:DNA polymerase III subunit gamma/tau [Deltaproteobacteria bacterium]
MSESYLVLARKYRPRTFEDLIGQTQVTRTLTRALETGRIAHAYLFTGPRGVGKTTAARLLAMALSCKAGGRRPCGVCQSCQEIKAGSSVDLFEVDGASNRGIGEIRALRETIKFLPIKNPRKVYIIDEVHALTPDAFNALLKTLEEPPAHVVFIFATTEAHKLPATFLSRCQRFDFRRIMVDDIVARLEDVSRAENIPADKDALTVIARQAEGGLRDALGLMDQVVAFGGEITLNAVDAALGLINQDLVVRAASCALNGDLAGALSVVDETYDLGYDFKELGLRVLELVRVLTIYRAAPGTGEFLDLTDAEAARYKAVSSNQTLGTLHRHLEAWLKFQGELARHPHPRWLMEAHLIRLCQMAPLGDLAVLAEKLACYLESGGRPADRPGPPSRSLDAPLSQSRGLLSDAPRPAAQATTTAAPPARQAEPARPAEVVKPAEEAEPQAPAARTGPVITPEPARPVEETKPAAEAVLPAGEVKTPAPAAQTEPEKTPEPAAPAEEAKPVAEAVKPAGEVQPVEEIKPRAPVVQAEPKKTPEPVRPADDVKPAEEVKTPAPAARTGPEKTPEDAPGERPARISEQAELIKRLSKAPFSEQRRDILETLPVIMRLKEELPGKFVSYKDNPANEVGLDDLDSDPESETDAASSEQSDDADENGGEV